MGAHLETIGHWEQAVVGPSSAPDFIVLEWRPLIGAQAPAMEQRMDAIREDRKKASKRALVLATCCGTPFRTRRDPLGRFTLFLIRQLVSGSRVSLTQGRAGPAGVETAGREHGSCNHAVGE